MRFIFLIAALLFSAAGFAAETIRIGVTGPFTGGSAPMGLSMRDGIRLAAREINAAGGVLGRQIELVERDDEARPQRGAQVVQDLINRERIHAALGVVNTGVGLACQRYYQEARIPMITSVATGSILTQQFRPPEHFDHYIFRVSANDTLQAEMIAAEAIDRRRLKRVAIFHDTTNYGQFGRDDLEQALARRGVKAVAIEKFNINDKDMSAQLQRARAAGAQIILTYGIGPELAQIANGRAKMGWDVPMVGSWPLAMSNFIDNAGPNAEGVRMPQTFIEDSPNPRHRSFVDNYRRLTGLPRMLSPTAAAQGYDSMMLLAAAIRQAGNTAGPAIREALESLNGRVEGVVQTYDKPFSRLNHEAIKSLAIPVMGEVRQGRVTYAYEDQRKQALKR